MSVDTVVPVPDAVETVETVDTTTRRPSEYADQMPRLERFAALAEDDPERAELRSSLIVEFLPVVHHLAQRHGRGYRAGIEDLVQVGTVGLINALDRWDPVQARGDFLGYLIPCVRGEILRYFRDRTWSMRVPRRLKDLSVAITRATGPLSHELGRAPRPSELAAHLGVDREEVLEALAAKANQHAGSLTAVDDESDRPLADTLGSRDRGLDKVEYRESLRPLIERLPHRERRILMLRFFDDRTQTQIAEEIGISQMHVSRLLARTLAELRQGLDV
ncbi:SigB/SigF/SigG family RNA polymerase sigma factor [Pseudonocardia pini]|uniref:SigB/SigF/SigG family RNA polymerase sigma factor n=1 Tax=Pseudonocardia pini TaxID=2758030 RepID=UPI0015F08D88|nr:SigB/SigF/SigG family RNA polymerase sigma factor [Pseudonocardia pini]